MNKTEPLIRLAKKTEIKDIVRLCALHAEYEKAEYDSTEKEQNLIKYLFSENPSSFCLVVELDNKIIGYSSYMKQFSTWDADFYTYMDCLFLTEESRGYGIGEKMMNVIKMEAKKQNCKLIQWQTPNFNTRAIKFYDRIVGISKTKERYFLKV